jgi:hypothetical protein
LQYIEKAYSRSAIPDALLLGLTTRFVADIRDRPSPLYAGIEKYSPHFRLIEGEHPPTLIRKNWMQSVQARLALMRLQPDRYRRGVYAMASHLAAGITPAFEVYDREFIRPANYRTTPFASRAAVEKKLATQDRWQDVHAWDFTRDSGRIREEVRLLLEYTSRHNMELYLVNLPEVSLNRVRYRPGRYEAYLRLIRSAIADTPFLDLRTFLADDEFYDEAHSTWSGAVRTSRRVASFIKQHRAPTQGSGHESN